jgi:hypothetical protein
MMEGEEKFQIYAGIDWAKDAHQVCVLDACGTVRTERQVEHNATALQELASMLIAAAGGEPAAVAVAIEVPHGAVVETLLERGVVVFALNPKQLDRFRDRFTTAGAKDDRRDARVLGDALRTDRRAFTRVRLPAAAVLELREETRIDDELRTQLLTWSDLSSHRNRFAIPLNRGRSFGLARPFQCRNEVRKARRYRRRFRRTPSGSR